MAPSSERNRIRNGDVNRSDEASQTTSPSMLDVATSCESSDLFSEEAIRVRTQLASSIVTPLLQQQQMNQQSFRSLDDSIQIATRATLADSQKIQQALHDLSQYTQENSKNLSSALAQMTMDTKSSNEQLQRAIMHNSDIMTMIAFQLSGGKQQASNNSDPKISASVKNVKSKDNNGKRTDSHEPPQKSSASHTKRESSTAEDDDSMASYSVESHHDSFQSAQSNQVNPVTFNATLPFQQPIHPSVPIPKSQFSQYHLYPVLNHHASTGPVPLPTAPGFSVPHSSTSPLGHSEPTNSQPPQTQNSTNLFNMNEFALAAQGQIKYKDIDKHLDKIVLKDDTMFHLEQLYSRLILAITYGFDTSIEHLPPFHHLHPDINFKTIFLQGLVGDSIIKKVTTMYNRIGELIKMRLTNSACISPDAAPKAARVVKLYQSFTGWTILEKLLKDRVVLCGAVPDQDLDTVRASLMFMQNEEYSQFYIRCHELQAEYELSCKNIAHVPYVKILQTFLEQLRRAPCYVPYLLPFQQVLRAHIKRHGDVDTSFGLPFTIHDVYGILQDNMVPDIPPSLDPSSSLSAGTTSFSDGAILASLDSYVDRHFDPSINAFQRNTNFAKNRCQACLIGIHPANQCYHRGDDFLPIELKQRIALYNKQHGNKRPPGVPVKEWNPKSIPAILDKQPNKVTFGDTHGKDKISNPFKNAPTKTKINEPVVNALTSHHYDDIPDHLRDLLAAEDHEDPSPNISSFITTQESQATKYDIADSDDVHTPVLCSITLPSPKLPFHAQQTGIGDAISSSVLASTPMKIQQLLHSVHEKNNFKPHRKFLLQHAHAIHMLPSSSFRQFCLITFHVDSGANVCAVKHKNLFYFYIDTETRAQQVDGTYFVAHGWGAILITVGLSTYLLAPVFYCPQNPRNTFSPQALKHFSGFQKVVIDVGTNMSLIDQLGVEHSLSMTSDNDLDFIDLNIVRMNDGNQVQTIEPIADDIRLDGRPTLNAMDATPTTTKCVEIINPEAEKNYIQGIHFQILDYYIELHPIHSPRQQAIHSINKVLNLAYQPPIHSQQQLVTQVQQSLLERPVLSSLDTASVSHDIDAPSLLPPPRNDNLVPISPMINKLSRSSKSYYSPLQQFQRLHLGALHMSPMLLHEMIKKQTLSDLPTSLAKDINQFNCQCYVCMLTKTNKIPRGHLEDKTTLPPFSRLHLDFHFFSVKSIRGFTSALAAVCGSTSYPFNFPTKAKTPPIDITLYLIRTVRSLGFQINIIRVDEDGALARSSEFCKAIINENIVLQTTGGGNSANNGMVERSNQFDANVVRPVLSTMQLLMRDKLPMDLGIEAFWCCALQMSTLIHRRIYNRLRGDSPYFLVHKKRPSAKELVPCGSLVTIIDPDKAKLPKLSTQRAKHCYFCAFGSNLKFIIYWDPDSPYTLKRSYHSIIEDTATFAILEDKVFATNKSHQPEIPEEVKASAVTERIFDICDTGFPDKEIKTITVTLPPYPEPLGLNLRDDVLYNLPFVQSAVRNSFAYKNIPSTMRTNHFIIAINADSPITKEYAIDLFRDIQKTELRQCTIDLVHRGRADNSTSLSISRVIFDNFPSYLQQKPVISSIHVPDTHKHFVSSPVCPDKPKSFFECLKSHLKSNWIAAAKIAFQKNKRVACFSLPFPIDELPDHAKVLRTLLVPEWKPTELPNVFEPRIRECIIGTPQQQYLDFDSSYAAVVDPTTVKIQITYTAAMNLIGFVFDIFNAFQNTFNKPGHEVFVTVPPIYMEWLYEEEGFTHDNNIKYCRQMFNASQGTKDASHQWKSLLVSILAEYGLHPSKVDHAFFWKPVENNKMILVSVATDDMLVSVPSVAYAEDFKQFLTKYFRLSVQHGPILKFLGLRIVQSNHAISIDQSEYIFDALTKYYGHNCDKIKTMSTPMRYDNKYERELFEAQPLSDHELVEYALTYNGTYRYHTGTLGFAANMTRWDIKYSVQRLAEFNNYPTALAFQSLARIYRYLAGDPHRPLTYPRAAFEDNSRLTYHITPANESELIIPNTPTNFNDAELGRCLKTRQSYYCTIVCVLGVIIQMRVKKTDTIMTHTTDSEMKANFEGCKALIPIRTIFQEIGVKLEEPSLLLCDNKAVTDIIEGERMTVRCRHIDIPIAFLHCHKGTIYREQLITTDKMLADMGTKPNSPAVHKRFKYWGTGERFLPPPNHEHYKHLQLLFYEKSFCEILQIVRDSYQNITKSDTSQDGGVVVIQTRQDSNHARTL